MGERDDIVAVVAVGREGVVWWGRGVTEEGLLLSVLPSVFLPVWNPYRKGGTNFPSLAPLSLFLRPCASLIRATYDA